MKVFANNTHPWFKSPHVLMYIETSVFLEVPVTSLLKSKLIRLPLAFFVKSKEENENMYGLEIHEGIPRKYTREIPSGIKTATWIK